MTVKFFLIIGALYGFLSVAFGAFGAHALKQYLSVEYQNVFETGVRYQMYHALALLLTSLIAYAFPASWFQWANWCFMIGTFVFSGSLYLLVLSGIRAWGAVTPIGGTILLLGWTCLLIGLLRLKI